MKTLCNSSQSRRIFGIFIPVLVLILSLADEARAGLNFEMDLDRYGQNTYYFSVNVSTNGIQDLPYGTYYFTSFGWPTNGDSALYQFDTNGFNQVGQGNWAIPDYGSMAYQLTNSAWTIYVTNTVTTNVYHFNVKLNTSSNDFPFVNITYPPNGATDVPAQPTFTWQGGALDYGQLIVFQGPNNDSIPLTDTSWQFPSPIPDGLQNFNVSYYSNSATCVVSSQPVDSGSHPISSWTSTGHLQDWNSSQFSVGLLDMSGTFHTLVGHYPFDATTGPVLSAANDTSGNGYDMSFGAGFGAQGGIALTSDAAAGVGALLFDDGDGSSGGILSWSPTPPALLNALAGSFSVSCWIKTTQNIDYSGDNAYNGAGIVSADVPGLANDSVPIALTGSSVAFNTGGNEDDTLASQATVNDGNYHHIVVTRNQQTGEKIIYVDGQFDSYASGTTNLLNSPQTIYIGAQGDASQSNPGNSYFYNGYDGELDDLQFYSGVLSSNDVANLFNNPGNTVPNGGGTTDFNTALGTSNLTWMTSGDTDWFVESTNTDGISPYAAQSGIVEGSQSSTLSVTVTGPGTLTFYWSSQDFNGGSFDYEFDIDGNYQDDIYDDTAWYQELSPGSGYSQPYTLSAGQHTLTWTTYAYGDDDPTEAGFLANVSFVQDNQPTITLNPFNQTNYPGYQVWLAAGATQTNATWQWYEVGSGAISGATSSYYIPTNSGTAGVAGSYYAIATTAGGSAITTTATVNFASAPLPPQWSTAFKSPFEAQDNSQVTKDYYYGCCTDTNGNLYAAAEFGGNVTVGSVNWESGPGGDGAAIVKQSPTGSPLWAVGITNNGNANAYAEDVAPAPGGGVYLAGNYTGNNWLGTNELFDNGNGNVFVAAFTAGGSNLWVKTFGSTNGDFMLVNSLASDPAGNVTVSALLGGGPVTIGTSNYVVSGQSGVLIQFGPSGNVLWSQLIPEFVQGLVSGSGGRLYASVNTTVAGGTTNVTIGGTSNLTDRTWAIACLNDTNGQAIWVRGVGTAYGSGNGNPYAVGLIDDVPVLAVSGTNLFATGVAYASTASFGNLNVNFGDLRGQYVARFDTNGNAFAANTYGSVTTTPRAAVANAQGDLYVSGLFDTYSFFGQDMIAAPEENRIEAGVFSQSFVAKFDINGNPLWADEAVSYYDSLFLGIALATNGVWASGWGQSGYYPQPEYIDFGTNHVFSDAQFVSGGAGGGTTIIWYPAGVLAKITDSVTAPTPVTLLNATTAGSNFQFQFLSVSGFNHDVLYRTNLLVGNWQTNSTILGDGTLKTVSIPFSLFSPAKQGFVRVTTQ